MMLDLFTGLSIGANLLHFIPSMLLLPIVMALCAAIYKILFIKLLPNKIYNFLLGPIALLGFFVWAVPMNMGFYEVFRSMF